MTLGMGIVCAASRMARWRKAWPDSRRSAAGRPCAPSTFLPSNASAPPIAPGSRRSILRVRLTDAGGWFDGEIRDTWSAYAGSRYLAPGATGAGTRGERDGLLGRG